MSILYGNGCGLIYKETTDWLTSDNPQLQLAGALAMGNFARGGKSYKTLMIEDLVGCCHYVMLFQYVSYITDVSSYPIYCLFVR